MKRNQANKRATHVRQLGEPSVDNVVNGGEADPDDKIKEGTGGRRDSHNRAIGLPSGGAQIEEHFNRKNTRLAVYAQERPRQ